MRYLLIGTFLIVSILLGTSIFGIITGEIAFAQTSSDGENSTTVSITDKLLNGLATELIIIIGAVFGFGLKALFKWLRSKGVDISMQQEEAFTNLLTNRFEMLAKESWSTMREDVKKDSKALEKYWEELQTGHIPVQFQTILRTQGSDFAKSLQKNDQFKDFAKQLTDKALEKLLKNVRTKLRSDYQKRMLDVLPNIASVAIDSAFDPKVTDAESWANNALGNMKALMFSAEALDNQENIMIILKAEANKRLQAILSR